MTTPYPPGWTTHFAPDGRCYYVLQVKNGGIHTQWQPPIGFPPSPETSPRVLEEEQEEEVSELPPQEIQKRPTFQRMPSAPKSASSSKNLRQFAAGHPPMSKVAERYVYQQSKEYKVQEKASFLIGDSYSVKCVSTGQLFFKVKGKSLSIADSKTLFDASGKPVYQVSEALLSMCGRMIISDASSMQPVITLRKKAFIPGIGTSGVQAWIGPFDEGDPYLEVQGDFFNKDFTVKEYATGRTLATVKRNSLTLSNKLFDTDCYVIRVIPDIDTALLVFFAIAIDEQYRD